MNVRIEDGIDGDQVRKAVSVKIRDANLDRVALRGIAQTLREASISILQIDDVIFCMRRYGVQQGVCTGNIRQAVAAAAPL